MVPLFSKLLPTINYSSINEIAVEIHKEMLVHITLYDIQAEDFFLNAGILSVKSEK